MNLSFDDTNYGMPLTPELKQLKVKALIISSMILFDSEIKKEIEAGRHIRVKREEQNTASALLRIMSRSKWERN